MKKTVVLVMILLLTFSLLTACNGNRGVNAPSNISSPENTAGAPPASDSSGNRADSNAQQETDWVNGMGNSAQPPKEKAISKNPDTSLPLIELSKGDVFENDSIRAEFINYEIMDIPALRQGNFSDSDPSYSHYMQFRFEITNKIGGNARITISDISVNETIFQERSYSYSDINPNVVYNEYKIQFSKDDKVDLDPTDIETVRFHFFIYDAGKGKGNYTEDPIYEGYLVFIMPKGLE